MYVLYQHKMVLKSEHLVQNRIEPTADFLKDMELIYGSSVDVPKVEEVVFPPPGTKESFLFDPKQVHPGLALDSGEPYTHIKQEPHTLHTMNIKNSTIAYVSRGKSWLPPIGMV